MRNASPHMRNFLSYSPYAYGETPRMHVNPHMRTTSLCKNKLSEICIFRHFCIWGSPYANFSCTKCEPIPRCESPSYANKYCSNTPKKNFLRIIWDPRMHNEVVRIRGFTCIRGPVSDVDLTRQRSLAESCVNQNLLDASVHTTTSKNRYSKY